MGVGREMQIDPGEDIRHVLVDERQPPGRGECCRAYQIARVDGRGQESHPRRLGQRPGRALDLLPRDVEMGVGEGLDIAEMIEMGMGDEDRADILGPQAAEAQTRGADHANARRRRRAPGWRRSQRGCSRHRPWRHGPSSVAPHSNRACAAAARHGWHKECRRRLPGSVRRIPAPRGSSRPSNPSS